MTATGQVVEPVAITGCGVVSTAGIGMDGLRALMDGTREPHTGPAVADDVAYPPIRLRTVPQFSLAERLARKGVRRLDRMTGFGLLASKEALESAGLTGSAEPRAGIGVVAGTSTGSIRSFAQLSAELQVPDQRPVISPSLFPNIVLNCCASQIAIWNNLHGPNATLAAGNVGGVSALRYGGNMIRRGHADGMVIGGIEELCPQLAWGWHRLGLVPAGGALGEGAAFLLAQRYPAQRPVLAELLAAEVGYYGSQQPRASLVRGLARQIERALTRSAVSADDVDVVSLGSGPSGIGWAERKAVVLALGRMPATFAMTDLVGECFSAAGAFQAAGLIARWSDGQHSGERVALLTSVGRDGNVGCAVLRR
ncbi:MAG TPA: beta-ketoacyl synthase N-terminal-like domain-containing protein [Micromonosporaceae bacterium]